MHRSLYISCLLIATAYAHTAHAQSADTTHDFVAMDKVIFQDDFSNDAVNSFPSLWYSRGCDSAHTIAKAAVVHKKGEGKALCIAATYAAKDPILIAPAMTGIDYLSNNFTLEYDFLLGSNNYNTTLLFDYGAACRFITFRIYHAENGWAITDNLPELSGEAAEHRATLPGFKYTEWHHFAVSYEHKKFTCYLDKKKILVANNYKFFPKGFMLQTNGSDLVSYTNVRLATADFSSAKISQFNKLLTGKKFTTHDIHFDVSKSAVKTESLTFIKQLATWLKAKQFIRLEIDGHTDNDGSPAANKQLSQARAEEVKRQLVAYGINSDRLTTKGYGDTKPVKSNGTAAGKANNRRVEFIKL